ncbi:MAG: hypothetical protein R3B45_01855 [Bdellovibrionota bacterium]
MDTQAEGLSKIILAILFFPTFFQTELLAFALGSNDPYAVMLIKRVLLLLPITSAIFGCWLTIPCLITIIVRQQRRIYLSALLVTWWDLFRSIFSFWGGIFAFAFKMIGWCTGLLRLFFMGIFLAVQDIILSPVRMAKDVGQDYFKPGIPWLSVFLTIFWTLIEAILFTFILTPLVLEILESLSGNELSEGLVQIPLSIMLFIVILGSFAILSTFGEAIKQKKISRIVQIAIFEVFVFVFEVMFLYREFVDALVPWFSQHSDGEFRMGITSILLISSFAWMGIRGVTWFLFASSGTPTLLAIIQRTGLEQPKGLQTAAIGDSQDTFKYIKNGFETVKNDMEWLSQKGDEIIGSFILPPLQIVAASINFCTLLISANHLFELPFKSFKNLLMAQELIKKSKNSTED